MGINEIQHNLRYITGQCSEKEESILGLQSISRDVADNVSHPRRLDPTMELITYFFVHVLYLQRGRHDVKCKPSIVYLVLVMSDPTNNPQKISKLPLPKPLSTSSLGYFLFTDPDSFVSANIVLGLQNFTASTQAFFDLHS